MIHLALHVYFWGDADETRLLLDCVGPAARELREDGLLERFWFTRFDTRGPHLFALLTSRPEHAAEVRERLGARLDLYLAEHPSTVTLADEVLERRHLECRGKQLSVIDAEPGIAPNNSYRMAGHAPGGYPFHLSAGVAREEELWRLVQELSFWTIEQQRSGNPTAAAVRWVAAVDRALSRAGADPAGFWRYHATTLLVYLEARLAADEARVLATLPGVVSERNQEAFSRLWDEAPPAPARALVDIVLAEDGRTPAQKRALLREINHCTLAQLGQPVMHHIPLILYAWQRNLLLHAA